jgi:hypothetical protein
MINAAAKRETGERRERGESLQPQLKIGDRVLVRVWKYGGRIKAETHGEIVGESRERDAWRVMGDGRRTAESYDKDFCHPEK